MSSITDGGGGYNGMARRATRQALRGGDSAPTIADLVGGVGRHLEGQRIVPRGTGVTPLSAYQPGPAAPAPAPAAAPAAAAPMPGNDSVMQLDNSLPVGGVGNLLHMRDLAMTSPAGRGPQISDLVGNVGQNLATRDMALQADPNNPIQRSILMAQNAPHPGQQGNVGIADLIRQIRRLQGF